MRKRGSDGQRRQGGQRSPKNYRRDTAPRALSEGAKENSGSHRVRPPGRSLFRLKPEGRLFRNAHRRLQITLPLQFVRRGGFDRGGIRRWRLNKVGGRGYDDGLRLFLGLRRKKDSVKQVRD